MTDKDKKLAKFLGSFAHTKNMPAEKKEICFLGRSNSGKSSLVSALFQNPSIVKKSARPGSTQVVNIYEYADIYLADLPGFGYAKVSRNIREKMSEMIFDYIAHRENLAAAFLLLDCKRDVGQEEEYIRNLFSDRRVPVQLVLTKTDRLNRKEKEQMKKKFSNYEKMFHNIIFTSAKKNQQIEFIINFINSL
ncbi:MAG: ribosome biogenesis GTP-binding protein YihA/YsxC [Spirochaetia bacterium]|nr:ribosome biogenesis GTP-binding protein YihA/YsxC [Spirochaetia bacterium]